ncbi:MAG: glycosyltransferase family 4 protein [Chloroflexi bacterium]|nr:glycosyltransferase family 4 protein [Chloroflexota bacterium]
MTTDVVGGVWDFCCALTSELTSLGHRVTLLALGEPSATQRNQARGACAELRSAPLKLEWMVGSAGDVQRSRLLLARMADELRPDVVHANQYALATAGVNAPVVLTAHSDVLSWHVWSTGQPADPEWQSYRELVRASLLAADAVVAVSAFLAAELTRLYDLDPGIRVIHNGWPAPPNSVPPPPAAGGEGRPALSEAEGVRAPAGQPSEPVREELTFLAGRLWDQAKNVPLAARAAAGWQPGPVLVAGEAHHPETGSHAVLQPPLESLGQLPRYELVRWLSLARVYLSPARYDPFGLLPLQAALAGCALLLSDIPSYLELWDGAAVFFRSDDEYDLRSKWATLLKSPTQAAAYAHKASQRARANYTAKRMAADYLALYQTLTARQRDAAGSRREAVA